jgi:hypothetical protein
MLGLESSVKWRGTDKVRATSLALPPVYARCLPEKPLTTGRIAVTLGSACQAQARRTASGAEPMTNRGPSPARPWRYPAGGVARAAPGLSRCGLPPVTSRPARGAGDRLVNRPDLAVSAHLGARPAANPTSGQGTVVKDAAAVAPRVASRTRPCPADPTAGEYGGHAAMRLRLPCGRLLGGLVGAWQPGQRW